MFNLTRMSLIEQHIAKLAELNKLIYNEHLNRGFTPDQCMLLTITLAKDFIDKYQPEQDTEL